MNREEFLTGLIKEKYGNVKHFAESVDIPYTTVVTMLKKGIGKAGVDNVIKICKSLNISIEELSEMEVSKSYLNQIIETSKILTPERQTNVYNFATDQLAEQNSNIVDLREYKDVYIQSSLSAGTGIVDLDQQHQELISYSGYVPAKYDMAFRVSGDSMEPLFQDGEVIFVEADKDVRNGQIGVVVIDGEAYVKKMYVEDKQLRLVSLNKEYADIIADSDIQIVGRAII